MKILTLKPSPLTSHLWRRWRDDITSAGKCLALGVALAGMGSVSVQVPIYQIFCVLVALLVVTEFTGFLFRPRVGLQGRVRSQAVVGDIVRTEMVLTNLGRWPAFDLEVGFFDPPPGTVEVLPPQMLPRLAHGASAVIPVEFRVLRRGLITLPDMYVFSTFPFNLRRFGSARSAISPILVTPNFPRVTLDSLARYSEAVGVGMTSTDRVGDSLDFLGNREYVPGEPLRRLDFRSWARLGRPIVREYQHDLMGRMSLIIDVEPFGTSRKLLRSSRRSVDAAVALAAGICESAVHDFEISSVMAGESVLYEHRREGRHVFEEVLAALAPLDAHAGAPIDWNALSLAGNPSSDAVVVLILLRWDEAREQFVRRLEHEQIPVTTFVIESGNERDSRPPRDGRIQTINRNEILRGGLLRL